MSLTRRESSDGVKNDVSDGVVLSHESPAAAVSQGQHDAEPIKYHHDDDDETNKIFVARNGSIGVPNGKKGTVLSTSLHVYTAIVGASILALPATFAWLGWVAGPILMWVFFGISMLASRMLACCYEANGIEHARYHHAVRHLMGRNSAIVVSVFQIVNLCFFSLIYTITASNAMVQIANLACSYQGKTQEEIAVTPSCLSPETGGDWKMSLAFGGFEMVFSQIKNLEDAWWSSLLGAISGVIYVLIIVIISFANISNGYGTVAGVTTATVCPSGQVISAADKVFGVLNGLGTIAFCFNFSLILFEVQDTLKQPPSAVKQMKRTCIWSIGSAFLCYFMVAVTGYAAEGDCVDSVVINSFITSNAGPKWALIICYATVLINMITSYQVFGQAMFDTLESQAKWYLIKRKMMKNKSLPPVREEDEGEDAYTSIPRVSKGRNKSGSRGGSLKNTPFDRRTTDPEVATIPSHGDIEPLELHGSCGFDHTCLNPVSDRLAAVCSAQIDDPYLSAAISGIISEPEVASPQDSGLHAMFTHATGFANEEVPLNHEGYLLPFKYRAVIRVTYVAIMTILACVLPFFESVVGISGAISFFPISIYYPFAMYRKMYGHTISKKFNLLLNMISVFTLSVGAAATVGAFRNMITGWTDFQIFNT
ncbi:Amino acid permease 3 [Picochlorum sp. SENEW3]|nr:Amino acid permease 3 [Picochlorum sp. SENEW3]